MGVQFCFNFLLLIEVITDLTVSGFYACYSTKFRIWPETICQFLNIYAVYLFAKEDDFVHIHDL